jgi:hypothetical protein
VNEKQTPGTEPPIPPAKRIRLDTNVVIAVSAVVISMCALVVSFYEVSVMRGDQRASVWPYLDVEMSYSADGFGIQAANNGIGPAVVRSVQVEVDGEPAEDWDDVIERLVGPNSGIDYSIYRVNPINGEVLPAETVARLFEVGGGWTDIKRQLADGFGRVSWRICYCSVYEECWTLDSAGDGRLEGVCRPDPPREFTN